jgi:hypothetical protein
MIRATIFRHSFGTNDRDSVNIDAIIQFVEELAPLSYLDLRCPLCWHCVRDLHVRAIRPTFHPARGSRLKPLSTAVGPQAVAPDPAT